LSNDEAGFFRFQVFFFGFGIKSEGPARFHKKKLSFLDFFIFNAQQIQNEIIAA